MQVLTTPTAAINRWDKDSIRPGPVGSVGDVNLQVKLKKSANYLPDRFQSQFSGRNEVYSGSNVSDGQYKGFTSGGRGGITLKLPLPPRDGFKTAVGWVFENIVPTDNSRQPKMGSLGQYSWEQEQARIYKAKTTGDQFLPLPMGYGKPNLPRGSQNPVIVARSYGVGTPLPAAEVNITDPVFGENGAIEVDVPSCSVEDNAKVWAPAMDDPRRKTFGPFFNNSYPYRYSTKGRTVWPPIGDGIEVYNLRTGQSSFINTSPCGSLFRDPEVPIPTKKERRQGPPKPPTAPGPSTGPNPGTPQKMR